MGRVVLFGDLSGHTAPLYPALETLGVDLVRLSGRPFVGIDLSFGEQTPRREIVPLTLEGSITVSLSCLGLDWR